MDDFTQRLLEKKNARKRKQEEAAAALKNIILASDTKKSPMKSRNPLVERNEDTREYQKNPKPTPRSDLSSKNDLDARNKHSREHIGKHESGNLAKKPPRQEKVSNKDFESKVSSNGSESIQDRMFRLRSQSNNFEDDIVESKKKPRTELGDREKTQNDNSWQNNKPKVEKSAGSLSERLAMFEGQNDQDKRSHSNHFEKSHSIADRNRKHENKNERHGNDSNNAKVRKTSSRKYISPAASTRIYSDSIVDQSVSMDFDSDENPFDISAILKEADAAEQREIQQTEYSKSSWSVTDYLTDDSPKVHGTEKGNTHVEEYASPKKERHVSQKKERHFSPKKERHVSPKKERHVSQKKERHVSPKKHFSPEKQGRKRESVNSVDENGEELSVFAKQIAKKQRAIKSPSQQENLSIIDEKLNKRTNEIYADTSGSKDQTKSSRHHRLDQSVEKRKAPRCPEEEISVTPAIDLPKTNDASNYRKEEKKSVKHEKRTAPPKPARKNRDVNQVESQSKTIVDNELSSKTSLLDKEIQGKEDSKKRAREERNPTKKSEDVAVGEMLQLDKVLLNEDSWRNHALPDIKESDSLPTGTASVDPAEIVFSPNSKTYKSVREKKSTKTPKKMRRSMSFSEGQPPQMHKSGYNEEASSRYNVVTTCMSPGQEENVSNSEKIKDLLDYAVSQQNIVIQASQALNMGLQGEDRKGSPEIVEGERLLLLATERRTACLNEVERLKHDVTTGIAPNEGCQPCKANLLISDIKLPLNGDFLLALRSGRMDLGVFHFVVLIQYGPKQIYSTKVRCTYDELSRNFLTFKERIELKNVPHDFVLTIKVFGMHTKRGDSIPRGKKQQTKDSPGLMKNVFSSLTPRRRVNSADDSPVRGSSPKPVFRTTSFTPCGVAQLNLAMVKSGKHALTKVPKNCPLEGFVEMNVDCQPQFTASARGFLTILEEVGEYTAWNRRWCVMQGDMISFWRFPDEETSKPSVGSIDLTKCVKNSVGMVPRMDCSRPNTFELIVKRPLSKNDTPSLLSTIQGNDIHTKYWASADNKEDRIAWMETLNRQLSDGKAWSVLKPRAKVYQPQNKDKNSTMSPRKYPSAVAV